MPRNAKYHGHYNASGGRHRYKKRRRGKRIAMVAFLLCMLILMCAVFWLDLDMRAMVDGTTDVLRTLMVTGLQTDTIMSVTDNDNNPEEAQFEYAFTDQKEDWLAKTPRDDMTDQQVEQSPIEMDVDFEDVDEGDGDRHTITMDTSVHLEVSDRTTELDQDYNVTEYYQQVELERQWRAEREIVNAKLWMLDLINKDRQAAGLQPVILGTNGAAQQHAEQMRDTCTMSHWDLAGGMKPYMRYALLDHENTGNYDAENVSGFDYCPPSGTWSPWTLSNAMVEEQQGFMDSPGHRDNILDPHHTAVNIGIATKNDGEQIWIVQHFEYGYAERVDVSRHPTGVIMLDALFTELLPSTDDILISVEYDAPTVPLTRGQLVRTYCYGGGEPSVMFVPPAEPGWFWDTHTTWTFPGGLWCPHPSTIPAHLPPATTHDEAYDIFLEARAAARADESDRTVRVPQVEANVFLVNDRILHMVAPDDFINRPGIYTFVVQINDTVFGKHVMFVN